MRQKLRELSQAWEFLQDARTLRANYGRGMRVDGYLSYRDHRPGGG